MGDRALVTFTADGYTTYSPAIYLHWKGSEVKALIIASAPRLRRHDPLYAAARFCGYCHQNLPGALGLGLLPEPNPTNPGFSWEEYSHGGAGVYLVNVSTGEVACHGGYGKAFNIDPDTFARV